MTRKNNSFIYLLLLFFVSILFYFVLFYKKTEDKNIILSDSFTELYSANILDIIEKNKHNSSVIKILQEEETNRLNIKNDIQKIQTKISAFCTNNSYVCKNFKFEKIHKKILNDKIFIRNIKNNQMFVGMDIAIDIIKNKSSLQALLNGQLPNDILIDWNKPLFLGGIENKDDKGTAKILGLIISLAYIGNELKNDNNEPLISFFNKDYPYITENQNISSDTNYTFASSNKIILFNDGKNSSWLSKLLDVSDEIDSLTLMSVWSENNNKGYIQWNNDSIKDRHKLLKKIKSIDIKSIKDINVGMIIAERYFDESSDNKIGYSSGLFGRIGFVIGVDSKTEEIITISYSKQIANNRSGFGIDIYEYSSDLNNNILQMFFTIID